MFEGLKKRINEREQQSLNEDIVYKVLNESSSDDVMDDMIGELEDEDIDIEDVAEKLPEYEAEEDIEDEDLENAEDVSDPSIKELAESTLLLPN